METMFRLLGLIIGFELAERLKHNPTFRRIQAVAGTIFLSAIAGFWAYAAYKLYQVGNQCHTGFTYWRARKTEPITWERPTT
jgi:hypothetical protein